MKELSIDDQIYLCKYHDIDNGLPYNLQIKEDEIAKLIDKYKSNGLYEQYRNLSEEDYEAIINKRKEPPKSKIEKILNKYQFDTDTMAYKYLVELLEYLNLNKRTSINDAYIEIAARYNKDKQHIQNAIYRITNPKHMNLSEVLRNKLDWIGAPKNKSINQENVISNITEEAEKDICKTQNIKTSEEIDNIYVKVPIKTLMELNYYKGYIDGLKEKRGEV